MNEELEPDFYPESLNLDEEKLLFLSLDRLVKESFFLMSGSCSRRVLKGEAEGFDFLNPLLILEMGLK